MHRVRKIVVYDYLILSMSEEDFEKLQSAIGRLFTFNSFFYQQVWHQCYYAEVDLAIIKSPLSSLKYVDC